MTRRVQRAKTERRLPRRILGGLLCLAVFPAGAAMADVIELRDGGTLEGKIIESGDTVTIELESGLTVTLQKSQILRIAEKALPTEELGRREAALTKGDAGARFELAMWCKAETLESDAERLLWSVLEIESEHIEARRELGFRRHGKVWLTTNDYERAHGKVLHDGEWLTAQEVEQRLEKSLTREDLANAKTLFRTAAGRSRQSDREAALEKFRALPDHLRRTTLLDAGKSFRSRERQFAVRELASSFGAGQKLWLAHTAVTDSKRSVRDEALAALQSIDDGDVVLSFLPYLQSSEDRHRINATRALNVFPDRRAVAPMIETFHLTWAGFGRAHIASVTQRSIISDYELVSGGTGFVVSEVADPVVDTLQEGVVLDVTIRRAELFARAATLQRITGQKFGTELDQWQSWWKENAGELDASYAQNR